MKRLALMLAILTVASACSSAAQPTESAVDAGSSDTSPATDAASPEGPVAPDFTMALGDGGTFTLSEETKPVYMIFWADW